MSITVTLSRVEKMLNAFIYVSRKAVKVDAKDDPYLKVIKQGLAEERNEALEAAALAYEHSRRYWPPLNDGCLCKGCNAWMPLDHPESHDHVAGCKYAFGDTTECQSPFNRPNPAAIIRAMKVPL